MKKQSILILLIILGGSSASIIYASGTTITNTSVTTPTLNAVNVNISGTCNGCGGGEGSFTTWNPTAFNYTNPRVNNNFICEAFMDNNGIMYFQQCSGNGLFGIALNGTLLVNQISGINTNYDNQQNKFSVFHTYLGHYTDTNDCGGSVDCVRVYKNGVFKKQLPFESAVFGSDSGFTISPDGKYIGLYGGDIGNTTKLIVRVFQGS